ncbi:universal stress protein [Halorientalis brevis]|uniref:Universal stress protein n=1 Tax=Halorientalis brevis TaxID=1126241 RepID=A0ABD6CBD8_9EURY|nr:universal stress protein [Halorientalis brevis]
MYDAVFAPTDGSDDSAIALDHAIELAERYDATLHTQYVIESVQVADAIEDFTESDVYARLEDAGRQAVDDVVERAQRADIDRIESSIVRGVPHEAILDYLDENDVDIVVMATAGREGAEREIIGSVTEKVIRSSPVPVVAVNVGDVA